MKDEAISKKVLWDNVKGWIEECVYYDGEKPKEIPLSELKILVAECPPIGKDSSYIRKARLDNEKKEGQKEVIRSVMNALIPFTESGGGEIDGIRITD